MKALEILKEVLDFMEKAIKVNPLSQDELNSEIQIYKEAIEELETLQNRNCTDCKFFIKDNPFYGICTKCVNTTKNQDLWLSNIEFLCNRFEPKDK